MNKQRLAAAIFIPPALLLGWVVFDLWRLISQGIIHPLTTELKLHVLPWFVLAAPTIYVLMQRGLHRYWHFVVAAALLDPPIMYWSWWWSQAGEDALTMIWASAALGAMAAPFMGFLVWLLAAHKANKASHSGGHRAAPEVRR